MSIKINGTDVVDDNRKGIFESTNVGAFANPARPTSASEGDLIYSTTDGKLQFWDGSEWKNAGGAEAVNISPLISGGSSYTAGQYTYRVFTSPGSLTINTENPVTVEYFVVAGGGGAGAPSGAGGGGAGGLLYGTASLNPGPYPVTVGGAGAIGSSGSNSTFNSQTAIGGGRGGASTTPGQPGGSGGGGAGGQPGSGGGSGTPGQGNPGGNAIPTNSISAGGGGYNTAGARPPGQVVPNLFMCGGMGTYDLSGLPTAVGGTDAKGQTFLAGGGTSRSGPPTPAPSWKDGYGAGGGFTNTTVFNAQPGAVFVRFQTTRLGG